MISKTRKCQMRPFLSIGKRKVANLDGILILCLRFVSVVDNVSHVEAFTGRNAKFEL